MEHISKPAFRVLEEITRKRVGRTMEALDLAGADELLKSAVKKQIWELKNDIESKVLESGENDYEQQSE
jgi:hypothetical protein